MIDSIVRFKTNQFKKWGFTTNRTVEFEKFFDGTIQINIWDYDENKHGSCLTKLTNLRKQDYIELKKAIDLAILELEKQEEAKQE